MTCDLGLATFSLWVLVPRSSFLDPAFFVRALFASVIPAEAGIQSFQFIMASRFRGSGSALEFFSILLGSLIGDRLGKNQFSAGHKSHRHYTVQAGFFSKLLVRHWLWDKIRKELHIIK